jgi:hypothetical protein
MPLIAVQVVISYGLPEATSSANACHSRASGCEGLNAARSPRRANVPVTSSVIGLISGPWSTRRNPGPPGKRPSAAARAMLTEVSMQP